jgi:pimeloyl-ACP methyl ester carboxylesterase
MKEKVYKTSFGSIHYWVNCIDPAKPSLVFLPGLTADHRLFDRQIEYFKDRCNVLVWDAPGHGQSWPFIFEFDLMDTAKWLCSILDQEKILSPLIVGQSMGGHLGQAFAELYPEDIKGFISVNSGPLPKKYMAPRELWILKRMGIFYSLCPWKLMLRLAGKGFATTAYGQKLMHDMMMTYGEDHARNRRVAGHGFKMLADAIEKDLEYALNCPAILICGEEDKISSIKRINETWHKETQIPLYWVKNAGHNSNAERPEIVNKIIETFVKNLEYN